MPSLQQLVFAVAPHDGRSVKEVTYHARVIRESGLTATTGRGGAAAKATIADAAILLIGLNCLAVGRGMRAATEMFMSLKPHRRPLLDGRDESADAADMLTHLLSLCSNLFEFVQLAINAAPALEDHLRIGGARQLRLGFRKGPIAYVRIVENRGGGFEVVTEATFVRDADLIMTKFYPEPSDRLVTAEIGLPALLALREALFQQDTPTQEGPQYKEQACLTS